MNTPNNDTNKDNDFKKGDRVTFSKMALDMPWMKRIHLNYRSGTIVGFPKKNKDRIKVLIDGRKSPLVWDSYYWVKI